MITDRLWGGTLEGVRLDARSQTIALGIGVHSGEVSRAFELHLLGVSQFQILQQHCCEMGVCQFTEFRATRDQATGEWTFDIVLWSEDAGMSGKCASISLDGIELAPSP